MTRRERFERKYSAWTGLCEEHIRARRMSNGSYSEPKIASAWYWFEDGFVTCKIDMEIEQDASR